jgi:competence protein ComFC
MGNGIIKFIADSILSVVYSREETCIICNSYNVEEELICKNCFKKVEFYNKGFKIKRDGTELECYSSAYYSGIVMELVRRLKYKSDFYSGEVLSEFLIQLLKNKSIDYDIITFIPMTQKALRARGFNQSKFLADSIGRNLHKPVLQLIKKIKSTKDQIGLDDISRWENLNECFKIKNKKLVQNKKILLVDDVVTTGATAFSSAKELFNNGAEKVIVLTVAKSRL